MSEETITFTRTGRCQWEAKFQGQTYMISKTRPDQWHLFQRVSPKGPAKWDLVRGVRSATAGHQPIGSTLSKATKNVAQFLRFGITPDDERWED